MPTWIFTLVQTFLVFIEIGLAAFWSADKTKYDYEPYIVLIGLLFPFIQYAKSKWGSIAASLGGNGENIGVEHYTTGIDSWKLGISGFFLRRRGIAVVSIFTFSLAGYLTFWQNHHRPYNVAFHSDLKAIHLIYICLFVSLSIYLFLSYYVRKRSERSLKMKENLHILLHKSRNEVCDLIARANLTNKRKSNKELLNMNES